MAKPKKGGLGRGLNSLLGSESDNSLPQEKMSPVERVKVDSREPVRFVPEAKPATSPRSEVPPAPVKKSPEPVEKAQEIYSSKEDNITIKSVVSRTVENAPAKKDVQVADSKPKPKVEEVKIREDEEVDIEKVHPNPNQPRTNFNKEELEELSESIKKNGLLQPVLVRKKDDGYEIIAGERRWQACKSIGMKKIPIRVREANDDETIMLALIENIQRSDLNPIEEAYGYRRLMERGKMSQTQVAQAVSKGRSTVANSLRLLDLPEEAQQLLFEDKITAGHARAILAVPTKEGRTKLTEKLKNEKLSVRETEAIARLMAGREEHKKVERPVLPKSYKTVARNLKEKLQTDVKVKSVNGKNKIEISFKDEADLERLFRMIAAE